MLGTVFHYAVVAARADHAECDAQRLGIIAYHERNGYKRGGAYNGHFCIHGGWWLAYTGPNQATGDTWANLNLEAWCYLGTVDTPFTAEAQATAYELTLRNPRNVYSHHQFFNTACAGPVRPWIAAGAPAPSSPPPPPPPPPKEQDVLIFISDDGSHWLVAPGRGYWGLSPANSDDLAFQGVPRTAVPGWYIPLVGSSAPVGNVEVQFPTFTVTPQ